MDKARRDFDIEMAQCVAGEMRLNDAIVKIAAQIDGESHSEIDSIRHHVEYAQGLILPAIEMQREMLEYLSSVLSMVDIRRKEAGYALERERQKTRDAQNRYMAEGTAKMEECLAKIAARLAKLEKLAKENGWEEPEEKQAARQKGKGGAK